MHSNSQSADEKSAHIGRRYDVCLSFAGEQRSYVERVAAHLRDAGVRVFYDVYEQVELWGKDLYQHLHQVYAKKSSYCVVFVSADYARKVWTSHELRSAQERAFRQHQEYLLPVRFDQTEIPGIFDQIGFLDLRKCTPEELGGHIVEKVRGTSDGERPVDGRPRRARRWRTRRVYITCLALAVAVSGIALWRVGWPNPLNGQAPRTFVPAAASAPASPGPSTSPSPSTQASASSPAGLPSSAAGESTRASRMPSGEPASAGDAVRWSGPIQLVNSYDELVNLDAIPGNAKHHDGLAGDIMVTRIGQTSDTTISLNMNNQTARLARWTGTGGPDLGQCRNIAGTGVFEVRDVTAGTVVCVETSEHRYAKVVIEQLVKDGNGTAIGFTGTATTWTSASG